MSAESDIQSYSSLLAEISDKIVFDQEEHSYVIDGERYVSVTKVIDETLAKPVLVPWASKVQSDADLAVVKDWLTHSLPAIMASPMNVKLLLDGLQKAKQAWKRDVGQARDIGSETHSLIEHECKRMLGLPTMEPSVSDDARYVFAGWKEWSESVGFKPHAVEARIYHRVHHVAGTIDVLASFNQFPLAIADWKSSSGIYEGHLLQMEEYQDILLSHGFPEELTAVIVRLPKDRPGKIEVRWVPHSTEGQNAFLGLLTAYQWRKGGKEAL